MRAPLCLGVVIAGRSGAERIDEATARVGWITKRLQTRQTGARTRPKSSREGAGLAHSQTASAGRCAAHSCGSPPGTATSVRRPARTHNGQIRTILVLLALAFCAASSAATGADHAAQTRALAAAMRPQLRLVPNLKIVIAIRDDVWGSTTSDIQHDGLVAYVSSSFWLSTYPATGQDLANGRWLCGRVALTAAGLGIPLRHIEIYGKPTRRQIARGFGDFGFMASCA